MTIQEVAMQITLKAMEQGRIPAPRTATSEPPEEIASKQAKLISDFYIEVFNRATEAYRGK